MGTYKDANIKHPSGFPNHASNTRMEEGERQEAYSMRAYRRGVVGEVHQRHLHLAVHLASEPFQRLAHVAAPPAAAGTVLLGALPRLRVELLTTWRR